MILNGERILKAWEKVPTFRNHPMFKSIRGRIASYLNEVNTASIRKAKCSSCQKKARMMKVGNLAKKDMDAIFAEVIRNNPKALKVMADEFKKAGIMLPTDRTLVIILPDKAGKPEFHRIRV